MKELFEKHPGTTILTCTRRGEQIANDVATAAKFGNRTPLAVLPGDIMQNRDNYDQNGKWREDIKPAPSRVPVHKGMKLVLTQNIRKDSDYVNGMECTVESFNGTDYGGVLRVRTDTGQRLSITRWTDVAHKKANYFPIRIGYASTVHKAQGGQFAHITVWLDAQFMPAAAYTALSRVSKGSDYLLAGKMQRHHFVPATFTHPSSYTG